MKLQFLGASMALALLTFSPSHAAEGRPFHFEGTHTGHHHVGHFHHKQRHNDVGLWPLHAIPAETVMEPEDDLTPAIPRIVVIQPTIPSCHHSEEKVTVPSAAGGGTKQITISRC